MLGKILRKLGLDWDQCALCGESTDMSSQGYLCSSCLSGIKPEIPSLRDPLPYVSAYRIYASYEGVLAEALRLIKFRSVKPSVKPLAHFLGKRIARDLGNFAREVSADILTFVPVHPLRYWARGFEGARNLTGKSF